MRVRPILFLPLALGALLLALSVWRFATRPASVPTKGKNPPMLASHRSENPRNYTAPNFLPDRAATPDETKAAIQETQVRTLVQNLKEAALRQDGATQEAMIAGLKKWKSSKTVLQEELAAVQNSQVAEALEKAIRGVE